MPPFRKSLKCAFAGLIHFFRNEKHARIHGAFAVVVVAGGAILQITLTEWLVLLLTIALVFVAEIFNVVIERICDYVQPAYHSKIRIIKNLGASAVLMAAIFALFIGLVIFFPYIWEWFSRAFNF